MISTMRTEEFVNVLQRYRKQEIVQKLVCVHDYNKFMGAINKIDMVISTIQSIRKNNKMVHKIFLPYNQYVVMERILSTQIEDRQDNVNSKKFHLKLIDQILKKYKKQQPSFSYTRQ